MASPSIRTAKEGSTIPESQEPPEADVVEWGSGDVVYSGSESTGEWMKVEKEALVSLDDWE